jgi:hypothetical protein
VARTRSPQSAVRAVSSDARRSPFMISSSPSQMLPDSFAAVVCAVQSGNFFVVYSSRPTVFRSNRYSQPLGGCIYNYSHRKDGRSGVRGRDRLAPQAGRLHTAFVRTAVASAAYKGCRRHHNHHHHPHSSPHSSSAVSPNTRHLLLTVLPSARNAYSITALCIATERGGV